ncbi:Segmentation protein even-skipped [Operophtera brumata]|uniref:Segmentation protein even-skipped n=1 Tax=Operophtera brumata TaxID=104452 RepID=A0A0L7LG94_OPEBR|nr:Segmentation protein even-skipped [Operophtera brumata]
MDTENKMQTKIQKNNFSIESIVGLKDHRRSPEIDIENSITQEFTEHSEDEEVKVRDGKMGYYFQQNRVPNFPFFMSYDKRAFEGPQEDLKRASPGSARSEVDSDGVDERPHGKCI